MSKLGLHLAILAATGGLENLATYDIKESNPHDPKPKFSDEELEILAGLEGKEKKKYVRMLKEKYKGVK